MNAWDYSEPPQFRFVLADQIISSSVPSFLVQHVKIISDDSMYAQSQTGAGVTTGCCVIDRITVWLYGSAYVSADMPDWCLLDDVREYIQETWSKMHCSAKHLVLISLYTNAYGNLSGMANSCDRLWRYFECCTGE